MAQWIPKTAWKVSNLNKRYGQAYTGVVRRGPSASPKELYFTSTEQPEKYILECDQFNSKHYDAKTLLAKYHDAAARRHVSIIDLRDEAERRRFPLPAAVPLHHHDILSGAASPILPTAKDAEVFVVATSRQRAVNGFNALRYYGYSNVVVADYAAFEASGCVHNDVASTNSVATP